MSGWPKGITTWQDGGTAYMSVPFTWLLHTAARRMAQGDMFVKKWVVGGPAVKLLPHLLESSKTVTVCTGDMAGVLQRVNPLATRTTVGCPRRCKFCGVGQRKIEGDFHELDDWPDLPIICDNNLAAASPEHFRRVVDRLVVHGCCDFNGGLDARLLTPWHAEQIARIPKAIVRVALDRDGDRPAWETAVQRLRTAGVAVSRIRSYVLCGFEGTPEQDWQRCEFVESHGIKALPMWFHRLDCLKYGEVTSETPCSQQERGWTKDSQRQLMQWYYKHRGQRAFELASDRD